MLVVRQITKTMSDGRNVNFWVFCENGMGGGGGMGMGHGPMDNNGITSGRVGRDTQTIRNQKTPSEMLQQNTKLSGKLQTLLPEGTNVPQAADGFKNLGEFVAAVHVSHNLNIPFDQLKGKITSGDNLGKAVQVLNPNLSHKQVKTEIRKGKHQAKEDIKASHHS